jgi:hypothetical protein
MAFTNPFSTKTAAVSTITAAEINAAGAILGACIDPVSGGDYTPLSPIRIGGTQGLRILNGGFLTILSGGTLSIPSGGILSGAGNSVVTLAGINTISGPTTISGTTTASDFTMSSTNRVKLASRSITRTQSALPDRTSATWSIDAQGTPFQSANNTNPLVFPLRIPHGATLTSVQVGIIPTGGHGGAPTMPTVQIGYSATAGFTSLGTTSDPTAFGSYQVAHDFGPTGLSHVVDRSTRRYVAIVVGETGANYVAGLSVMCVKCTYTITEYDED